MNYELAAKLLRGNFSDDDVKEIVHLYIQSYDNINRMEETIQYQKTLIQILEAENKILKEEANKHDY